MSVGVRINSFADLPHAISRMQAAGANHSAVPLIALNRGLIAYLNVHQGTSARKIKQFVALAARPALIIVGDDGDFPSGPEAWPQVKRLFKWANRVIVHAAAGRVEEYEEAVLETLLVGRVLMIETSTAHMEAWQLMAVDGRPDHAVHVIVPSHGPHPAPVPREKMQ